MSRIITETCDAIFEALAGKYLHPPSSTEEWEYIACDFHATWNLPHVVGAIDGKHIRVQCPNQSSDFLYCWQFVMFAMLLMLFDAGQYGSNDDAGVLANSSIGKNK